MHERIRSLLEAVDRLVARTPIAADDQSGVLLGFLFHGLYLSADEARSGTVEPQQEITVQMFRHFVEHFLEHSYRFVSPADIAQGLPEAGKYVLVTFDDGYYNNVRALPVLNEFNVPAVFFISTGHVKQGKGFWWDAAYRQGCRHGIPKTQISRLCVELKRLRTADAEHRVQKEFGAAAMIPVGDLDRPFTPSELKDFSRHSLVSLGNHTADHAILTNYSSAEAQAQIQAAQDDILAMAGKTSEMIAYPNGKVSPAVLTAARKVGLRLGAGVSPGHNLLRLEPGSDEAMALKRFTLSAEGEIETQCRVSRSKVSLYRSARAMKHKAATYSAE